MHTKFVQLLLAGALFFSLQPSIALATPEEDFASAEKSFNEEDIKEATRYLRLAADQNYFPAQVRLGELMTGSTDYEEGFGWFLTAAFQGDAEGQYNLGQMYALGYGTEINPDKAFFWTKKSAEQNYLPAVKLLAGLYQSPEDGNKLKNILGITPNKEQADFWGAKLPDLQKAADKKTKQARIAYEKRQSDLAEKAKQEQSKLLCGLKC